MSTLLATPDTSDCLFTDYAAPVSLHDRVAIASLANLIAGGDSLTGAVSSAFHAADEYMRQRAERSK